MQARNKVFVVFLIAVVALIAGVATSTYLFQSSGLPADGAMQSGTRLNTPRPIPDFSLLSADGATFTRDQLRGQWSVVFVGFTHCPDICPNTLALLKTVRARLQAEQRPLQVVFLSVDPQRDTPEVIANYVNYFGEGFVGATGEIEQLESLGRAMGFVFLKAPGDDENNYNVDHSAALIVTNPQGQVEAYFTPPLKADALVEDFSRLIEART